MKNFKKIIAVVLCIISLISAIAIPTSAITQSASYGNEAEDSGDYAYWNGSKMVKSSSTTKDEVRWMQNMLNHCIKFECVNATLLTVDGSFGPASKAATIAFQKAAGLTPDGSFGPSTIKKIKAVVNDNRRNSLVTNTTNTPSAPTSSWMWPCKTQSLSCDFGDTYYHTSWTHRGIDIRANYEDVFASKSGTVYQMGYNSSRGYWLVIDHGDGYYSAYQHLNKYYVKTGTYVSQGAVIAQSGNSGQGSGAHLHFEILNLGKTGLAKSYGNYFSQYSKYINTNPQQSMKAGFRLNNGQYVSTFKDSKGIEYIYK